MKVSHVLGKHYTSPHSPVLNIDCFMHVNITKAYEYTLPTGFRFFLSILAFELRTFRIARQMLYHLSHASSLTFLAM
jgi:hypothetical protein